VDIEAESLGKKQRLTSGTVLRYVGQWIVLMFGLAIFALSVVLQVRANLGLGPWDIFHVGLAQVSSLTLGQVSILTGVAVVGVSYVIARVKPGLATVANMLFIGLFIDMMYDSVPSMTDFPWKVVMFVSGMVLMGIATAVYIGAGLGAGPRDSLMLGLHRATGRSVRVARTIVEGSVFVIGFVLCGKFGLGTILFVAGIGPIVQFFMTLLRVRVDV
jgi:uncharacterized membrane protein YczE